MASHGTDQLLVQRLLTCRNQRDSQKALITSGFVVLFQFALFLTIGVMLYAYYQHAPLPPLTSNDEIFPVFIVHRLPHGIAGLVIAAVFAAAMSNLSGSLNSLASTTVLDFYKPIAGAGRSDAAAAQALALVHGRRGASSSSGSRSSLAAGARCSRPACRSPRSSTARCSARSCSAS